MSFFRYILPIIHPHGIPKIHLPNTQSNRKEIVLLLGWGGSKRKNLNKLVSYYQSIGVPVISHTMPLLCVGFIRDFLEELVAEEVKKHLNDNCNSQLLIHSFSNNGMWVYSSLYQRKLLPYPKAVIFDAAPLLWYQKSTLLEAKEISQIVVSTLLRGPIYKHFILTPVSTSILYIFISIIKGIQIIFPKVHILPRLIELNRYVKDHSPVVPMLFMYSKGDFLIHYKLIQDYMKVLETRGVSVSSKLFGEEVAHTGCFFKYPEEYISILESHFFKTLD